MTTGAEFSGLQIGLAMGAASMISVGPNNLMLLREGLMRGRSGLMVGLVLGSYSLLVLLALGAAAASLSIERGLQAALCWGGFAALSWFAIQSFGAAFNRRGQQDATWCKETPLACTRRVLAVLWCNPLTYVELLLIPTALAQSMTADGDRIEFAVALIAVSALCCFGYAFGGNALARVVGSRKGLRIFDLASGVILAAVAIGLAAKLASNLA